MGGGGGGWGVNMPITTNLPTVIPPPPLPPQLISRHLSPSDPFPADPDLPPEPVPGCPFGRMRIRRGAEKGGLGRAR